ncbi:MAG: FMN-binding protein [Clostridia bacterium]|nr:FMN-binding protein [Clostridia bacterium]
MKTFRSLLALVMALCLALGASCAFADQTLEGDANVDQRFYPAVTPFIHPPFYNVKLAVEVDDNGVITNVTDNGTGGAGSVQEGNEEFWANKNKPYFDAAVNGGLLEKFVGKTLEEVKAMDMTSGGVDTVSGATLVSIAAQEAVVNALEGKAGKTFLEVEGSALPVESIDGNVVTLKNALPEDFDVQVLDIRWGVRNEEIIPADSYTVEMADGKVTITFRDAASLKAGYYYVNVVDASGKYRSPSFEGGPAAAQAPYFIIDSGLTAEDISFDGQCVVLSSGSMADYLQNIEHVLILAEGAEKATEQVIVGHHGTASTFIALDKNGTLNADGVVKARNGSESPLFEDGVNYTVNVAAFGYPELSFSYVKSEDAAETGILPAIAGETGTTYVSLFDVIISDRWTPVWQDYIAAVIGEEDAPMMTVGLQSAITSELYGEAAVDTFANGGYAFDCDFINDAQSITFKDDTATILKTDGTSETHTYEYLGQVSIGENETMMYQGMEISMAFPVDVYRSTDEAGEFNYFFLREDTMAETYHIEFRYGKDLEELKGYLVGPYAYWLAAGIDENADDETIRRVIALFCLENMDYSAHAEAALAQLSDLGFVGTWQADMTPFGEAYANVELTMTIDENGHGVTFMNGVQTADFEAYAVDNGEKGDGMGLYVAYSNLEGEAEAAPYAMTVNDAGQTVLTLTADDGTISWVRQEAPSVIEIATAEQLLALAQAVNDGSVQGYPGQTFVLTADIDLTGIEWQPIGHMDLEDMGNTSRMFFGTFDGQGHTISNVTFNSDYPICGAGVIGMNCGEVKNLTVENVQIRCTDTFSMAVGGVVGYNMGSVHDVCLTGENDIAGVNCVGGIVGGNMGAVYNCTVENATIRVLGDNDFSSGRIIQADVAECGGLVIGGSFGGVIDSCTAQGKVIAEGNEPVGLGGVAGCLEMMDSVTNCSADVEIITTQGGHAIGGLCGFGGTHSNGMIVAETEGIVTTQYPAIIDNCTVTVKMNVPGATHVGGLVGTGLYYYGEETAFQITHCAVNGEIIGAMTPGAVAGRAVNSVIESCEAKVSLDGEPLTDEIGTTAVMYESGDQFEGEADGV